MKELRCLMVVICSAIAFFVSFAGAQDKQWLQYRSAEEAKQIVGGIYGKYFKVQQAKPKNVRLGEFQYHSPVFVRWPTPRVESGGLWIALDHSGRASVYDLLFIDSNCDGHLDDETAVAAVLTEPRHSYFGPVKVTFKGKDSPVVYHLNFRLCDHGNRMLLIRPAGWYEGTITVGSGKSYCQLYDYNVNGTFNDQSINANDCDRIHIATAASMNTRFVGNYVEIGGKLYQLQVAQAGAYVALATAEGVSFGTVRMPENITEFAAGGENGLFIRQPEKGIAELPVGEYRIDRWSIARKDSSGINWKMEGSGFSDSSLFQVRETAEIELSIGEPVISTIEAQDRGGIYYFSQRLKGKLGESIQITRQGKRAPAPKLRLQSEDGSFDRTYDFRYG